MVKIEYRKKREFYKVLFDQPSVAVIQRSMTPSRTSKQPALLGLNGLLFLPLGLAGFRIVHFVDNFVPVGD